MQQQPQMNPQAAMPAPPQMVSTKDAMYFADMMSWNLLAAKKRTFSPRNAAILKWRRRSSAPGKCTNAIMT